MDDDVAGEEETGVEGAGVVEAVEERGGVDSSGAGGMAGGRLGAMFMLAVVAGVIAVVAVAAGTGGIHPW